MGKDIFVVTVLKFLLFKDRAPYFHLVLGLANCIAGPVMIIGE